MERKSRKITYSFKVIFTVFLLSSFIGMISGCSDEKSRSDKAETPVTHVPGTTGCTLSINPVCTGGTVYVRSGAGGSGTSWTDALPDLPSSLVRNTTYYVAGGTYGSHTFNDAESSTDYICIKRATAADHGTDTGWLAAYGTDPAIFSPLTFTRSYYLFDGMTSNGFRILGTTGSVDDYLVSIQASYISFKNSDLDGNFTETSNYHTGGACKGFGIGDASPYFSSYVTIDGNEIHKIADDGMQIYNSNYMCIKNNTIHTLHSSGTDGIIVGSGPCNNGHSDSVEIFNLENTEFSRNFIYDNESENTNSAFFFGNVADLYGGYDAYCKNITFTNNIFYLPDPKAGFVMYIEEADGVALYNNVFWGIKNGSYGGISIGTVYNLDMYNNIILSINYEHVGGTYDPSHHRGDHNLFGVALGQYPLNTNDILNADPGFTGINGATGPAISNPVTTYFQLSGGSPGIDKGYSGDSDIIIPATDFNGTSRPLGNGIDIGAFEN